MRRFPLLKFFKVEGHKGIEGNEKANLLAQQAIAQPKGKMLSHVKGNLFKFRFHFGFGPLPFTIFTLVTIYRLCP